jgi:hypothetical protein
VKQLQASLQALQLVCSSAQVRMRAQLVAAVFAVVWVLFAVWACLPGRVGQLNLVLTTDVSLVLMRQFLACQHASNLSCFLGLAEQ